MAPADAFTWTPGARRSVNVLVAMQAMHLCATQVVMLASDDLLVSLLRAQFRKKIQRKAVAEGADEAERAAAEEEFEKEVKIKANSRGAHIMSMVMIVISLADFVIGPLLGGIADAWGRKFLMLIAPTLQGIFRAAIALRPSVPLFVAFQMVQGVTNIMTARVIQLMIGDIVPRHTFEYQRVWGVSSKVNAEPQPQRRRGGGARGGLLCCRPQPVLPRTQGLRRRYLPLRRHSHRLTRRQLHVGTTSTGSAGSLLRTIPLSVSLRRCRRSRRPSRRSLARTARCL